MVANGFQNYVLIRERTCISYTCQWLECFRFGYHIGTHNFYFLEVHMFSVWINIVEILPTNHYHMVEVMDDRTIIIISLLRCGTQLVPLTRRDEGGLFLNEVEGSSWDQFNLRSKFNVTSWFHRLPIRLLRELSADRQPIKWIRTQINHPYIVINRPPNKNPQNNNKQTKNKTNNDNTKFGRN